MSKKTAFSILTIIVLFLAVAVFFICGGAKLLEPEQKETLPSNGEAEVFVSSSDVYINEAASDSRSSLLLSDGSAPDWIELYNGSGGAVSLSGMGLTDDISGGVKYTFSNVTLGAGEYLVVLLTGTEGEADGQYLTAGFRLSSSGTDSICLTDASGQPVQEITLPALYPDISYGRCADGSYQYFAAATPGAQNSAVSSPSADFAGISLPPGDIVINEYQLTNSLTLRDADGEYGEWVEIKNIGAEPVSLDGYGLSDSIQNMGKWHFPEMTLEPGQLAVVFLSGKNRTEGELHANFGLSSAETHLILTNQSGAAVDIIDLKTDAAAASVGRSMQDVAAWLYYPSPTPGRDNAAKGFSRIDVNEEKYLPG